MEIGDKFKHDDDGIIYTVNNITEDEIMISYEGELVTYSIKEFNEEIKPIITMII